MRYSLTMFAALVALTLMSPAQAEGTGKVFLPDGSLDVAQATRDEPTPQEDSDQERRDREQERRDRAEARRDRAEARRDRTERRGDRSPVSHQPRFWIGVGAGGGAVTYSVPCSGSNPNTYDCTNAGNIGTYSANLTITGPAGGMRLRGLREQDRNSQKYVPYEEAAMLGSRFGDSNWYGFAGVGRLIHISNKHPDDSHGFAWEILFAPSTESNVGMEFGVQGELGNDVDYIGANVGMRFGALR